MMNEAASFSLKPGLNRCLQMAKKFHSGKDIITHFLLDVFTRRQTIQYSLKQLNGLASEAGEASVQHERYQGDHRIHVGSDAAQGC